MTVAPLILVSEAIYIQIKAKDEITCIIMCNNLIIFNYRRGKGIFMILVILGADLYQVLVRRV